MANFDYNKIILGGRLTGDPDLRMTPSGTSVATFRMAVNRHHSSGDNEATFFRVTAWQKNAEFVARGFRKGDSIFVTGRAVNNQYEDRQGVKHQSCEVIAEEIKYVDSKKEREAGQPGQAEPERAENAGAEVADEDIPF